MLQSIFLDEWNAYLNMELLGSIDIKFKLFGQKHLIHLNVANGDIKAYTSLGGM